MVLILKLHCDDEVDLIFSTKICDKLNIILELESF